MVATGTQLAPVLLVEDNPGDVEITRRAFTKADIRNPLHVVRDGQEAMEFLEHRGSYAGGEKVAPRPGLILLDLNLPRLDGREVLRRIKNDPHLSPIPVVVLTTSNDEEDVLSCYDAGANTYVTKPIAFDGFLKTVRTIDRYWFSTAEIPHAREN